MSNGVSGLSYQTYTPVKVPLIMGVMLQSPGNYIYEQYPITFNATTAIPSYTYYPVSFTVLPLYPVSATHAVDFTVIEGVAVKYAVDFSVIAKPTTNYPVSFNVVYAESYPVDFSVVGVARSLHGITFSVYGPHVYSGTASFNITESAPFKFYAIDFNVLKNITNSTMVSYYVNSGSAARGIRSIASKYPSGSATAGLHQFTSKIYQSGTYIGSSDTTLRLTSGTGVNVDFLGIPYVCAGTMLIKTYDRGNLIHTHSGSYQENLGVKVL